MCYVLMLMAMFMRCCWDAAEDLAVLIPNVFQDGKCNDISTPTPAQRSAGKSGRELNTGPYGKGT